MPTKQFSLLRDINVRLATGTAHDEEHMLVGQGQYRYRGYLRFLENWSGVGQIISAKLRLTNSGGVHWTVGAEPRIRVRMLGASLIEDEGLTSGEDDFSAPPQDPLALSSPTMVKTLNRTAGAVNDIDITAIVEEWAPNTVKRRDGRPGAGRPMYGVRLTADVETDTTRRAEFWSKSAPLAAHRPVIVLEYDSLPANPNVPDTLTPTGAILAPQNFSGHFSDPNVSSRLKATEIKVYAVGGLTPIWQTTHQATESQRLSGVFDVPPPASLNQGTTYEWTARVQDNSGRWSDVSPRVSFIVGNTPPTLALMAPSGSLDTLKAQNFRGQFSDADSDDILTRYRIQLTTARTPSDPGWDDPEQILWDTGWLWATDSERFGSNVVGVRPGIFDRAYAGRALQADDYSWRARVADRFDGESDWEYLDFTLTEDYDPSPGAGEFLTPYDKPGATRVLIYGMDGADRGPTGNPVAIIEDAANIGAAKYMNAPGEFYMTLPATHPQVSEIEPWRRHYAVEVWNGDRFVPRFFGIITDFDATDDDVVFYGIDYLGLLALVVDTRYDFSAPDKPYTSGGSKYVTETVTAIISNLLTYARTKPDSPVEFITLGSLATFSEEVTIYSTYAELLGLIVGLVDSHRQGSGKSSQIDVRRTNAGEFQFRLFDDPGVVRNNLRMEYGGLVQGFRLIGFGDFATVTHGIGRTKEGTKVFSRTATAPGLTISGANGYGRIERARFFDGVTDANDLGRRTKQVAASAGRIGKRVALGLRVDAIMPFEGYGIGDYIPVDIRRGVVDTNAYGSGYWTVVGCEWRVYPDGHTENTFVVLPREDGVAPDPDLIPSDEILGGLEWEIDYGVPVPGTNVSKLYLDLSTGNTYQIEPDGSYTLVDAPTALPAPTGLTPTTSVKSDADGHWLSVLTVGLVQPTGDGLSHSVVEITNEESGGSPVWTNSQKVVVPADKATVEIEGVPGATEHWVRTYSVTNWQQESAPSTVQSVVTAKDTVAPATPTGLQVTGQFRALRADWDDSAEADLSHYEVRYGLDAPSPTWLATVRADASLLTIPALNHGATYAVEVRAVDRSGNASAWCAKDTAATVAVDQVENNPATVTIDDDGITILDGAINLLDPSGNSVLSAAGFEGSWRDFVASGIYNNQWAYGSDFTLASHGANHSTFPYWFFEMFLGGGAPSHWGRKVVSGSPVLFMLDQDTDVADVIGYARQDQPGGTPSFPITVIGGQRYQIVAATKLDGAVGKPAILRVILNWLKSNGSSAAVDSAQIASVTADEGGITWHSAFIDVPEDAVRASLSLELTHQGTVLAKESRIFYIGMQLANSYWSGEPGVDVVSTDKDVFTDGQVTAQRVEADDMVIGGVTLQSPSSNLEILTTIDVPAVISGNGLVLNGAGYIQMEEISTPGAPNVNLGRLYLRDNGSGKTQLVIRFNTGAVQVIATEP